MEDLLPLLVFAIISAISHLVNKRKESREEVTWEELEEMQDREETSQAAGPASPPPVPLPGTSDTAPKSAFEEFERMVREMRAGTETPTSLPPKSSRPEPPPVAIGQQDLSGRNRPSSVKPAVNEALELARAEKERARKDLEKARQKADHLMEKAKGDSRPVFLSGPARTGGLWGNPESVRQAFIASVVFDKPLAYKSEDTDIM